MYKFIYVFSSQAKDMMIVRGYTLLKSDERNNTYVFEGKKEQLFALDTEPFVLSDTLTF